MALPITRLVKHAESPELVIVVLALRTRIDTPWGRPTRKDETGHPRLCEDEMLAPLPLLVSPLSKRWSIRGRQYGAEGKGHSEAVALGNRQPLRQFPETASRSELGWKGREPWGQGLILAPSPGALGLQDAGAGSEHMVLTIICVSAPPPSRHLTPLAKCTCSRCREGRRGIRSWTEVTGYAAEWKTLVGCASSEPTKASGSAPVKLNDTITALAGLYRRCRGEADCLSSVTEDLC